MVIGKGEVDGDEGFADCGEAVEEFDGAGEVDVEGTGNGGLLDRGEVEGEHTFGAVGDVAQRREFGGGDGGDGGVG